MNNKIFRATGCLLFVICALCYYFVLLYFTCRNTLCFQHQIGVFVGDCGITSNIIAQPAGLANLCALWLTQWFDTPAMAVLVASLLLTAVAGMVAWCIKYFGGKWWLMPMSVVPGTALALMSMSLDYRFTGTVAFAMMLICVMLEVMPKKAWVRLIVAAALTLFLSWATAAVSMLFAVVVINIELLRRWRTSPLFIITAVLAYAMGCYWVHQGCWRDMSHALLPYCYYVQWINVDALSMLPWIVALIEVNVCALFAMLSKPGVKTVVAVIAAQLIGLAAMIAVGVRDGYNQERDAFARLSYLSSNERWTEVVAEYKTMPQDNVTLQNFVNMALAERDMLCDVLFNHYNQGVASLHNSADRSPYTYMLLSDVYYSMGLVALAQRYAFEANEALGNYSPTMIKRLVDTNIITGQYDVAAKYLRLLDHTRYSQWANERRQLLYDDKAVEQHQQLAAKRKCLFADNRFAGDRGIDDDLLQALRANPKHKSTMQYLAAYYMLSKNVPKFIGVVEEFYGTDALRIPLPEHMQEAVVVDAIVNGGGIDTKYQIHPSVMQRCKAFWAEHQPQPNTFWHYLRNSRLAPVHDKNYNQIQQN